MLNLEVISKKISDQRKQIGMTQNELADKLFVTRQAVSKWEMGKSLPSVEVLIEMTELFDVTIDYMLDGSDIKDNDYQAMFMQYPRESVIYRYINSNHLNEHLKHIFYLLTQKERSQMIDQMLSGQLIIDLPELWPHLSIPERKYLLGNLLSKDMDKELEDLYQMMSTDEKLMVNLDQHHLVSYGKVLHKKSKGESKNK